MPRDLEKLARQLAGRGPSLDDPDEAAEILDRDPPSPDESAELARLMVENGCYRVAQRLIRDCVRLDRNLATRLHGAEDLVSVLIDLQYGPTPPEEVDGAPLPGPTEPAEGEPKADGEFEDADTTAVRARTLSNTDDYSFEEAKTQRWTLKVPFGPLRTGMLTPAPGELESQEAAFERWFVTLADAARAVQDGKCKLARALLEGLAQREPQRPEAVAALAYVSLAEGNPQVGLGLVRDAQQRLGPSIVLERAAERLEAHSGEVLDLPRAGRLAVENFVGLIARVTGGLLS